jgi:hypothetical protein
MRILIGLILSALAMTALSAAPAYAQMPTMNMVPDMPSKTPEEKEQDAIKDKAYKDSLRKIPDAKTSSDPWGTVRSNDAPKTAAPAKPKTKTGSNVQRSQ